MTDFDQIADLYIEQLSKYGDSFLKSIGRDKSVRDILIHVYRQLVLKKLCTPMESLPDDQKRELWSSAKEISSRQEKNYVIEVCKALYGFSAYMELKQKVK